MLRAEKCSPNHLKHNDSRDAFLIFSEVLRAAEKLDRNAKCETRKSPSKNHRISYAKRRSEWSFGPKNVAQTIIKYRARARGRPGCANPLFACRLSTFSGSPKRTLATSVRRETERQTDRHRTEGCRPARYGGGGGGGGGRRPAGRASAVRAGVRRHDWEKYPVQVERSAPPPFLFPFTPT